MFFSEIRLAFRQVALWKTLLRFEATNAPATSPTGSGVGLGEARCVARGWGEAESAVRIELGRHASAMTVLPAPSLGTKSIAIG